MKENMTADKELEEKMDTAKVVRPSNKTKETTNYYKKSLAALRSKWKIIAIGALSIAAIAVVLAVITAQKPIKSSVTGEGVTKTGEHRYNVEFSDGEWEKIVVLDVRQDDCSVNVQSSDTVYSNKEALCGTGPQNLTLTIPSIETYYYSYTLDPKHVQTITSKKADHQNKKITDTEFTAVEINVRKVLSEAEKQKVKEFSDKAKKEEEARAAEVAAKALADANAAKAASLSKPKSDGIYTVGSEIEAGKWRSSGSGSSCYWKISPDGQPDNIVDNHYGLAGGSVTLSGGQEFQTRGCGTWTKAD